MSDARSVADVRAHQVGDDAHAARFHRLRTSAVSYGLQIEDIQCANTELTRGNATAPDVCTLMRLRNPRAVHPITDCDASHLLPHCDAVAATSIAQLGTTSP